MAGGEGVELLFHLLLSSSRKSLPTARTVTLHNENIRRAGEGARGAQTYFPLHSVIKFTFILAALSELRSERARTSKQKEGKRRKKMLKRREKSCLGWAAGWESAVQTDFPVDFITLLMFLMQHTKRRSGGALEGSSECLQSLPLLNGFLRN
jgi:hypothetical protein